MESGETTDLALYRDVVSRMDQMGYYDAAVGAHAKFGYPVEPFYTVRLPTLATLNHALGETGSLVLGLLLVLTAALVWHRRLGTPFSRIIAVALVAFVGANGLLSASVIYIHDWWAGMLITIALGLRNWRASLLVALCAALVRELAIPLLALYPLVHRRREVLVWAGAAIMLCLAYLLMHKLAVESHYDTSHEISTGWFGLRGPMAVLNDLARLTDLARIGLASPWLALVPLAGWLMARDGLVLLWLAGVAAAVGVVARPDNYYWAELVLPLYAVGLAYLALELEQLLRGRGG